MTRHLTFAVARLIGASNDAVWDVLADVGTEHRWTTTVGHCTRDTAEVRVGTVRSCRLPRPLMGRTHVRETLTDFEPRRALSYALEGAAGPFAVASSRWRTTPTASEATVVTVEGTFVPKHGFVRVLVSPFVKPMVRRLARRVLRELEAFLVPTGVADAARRRPQAVSARHR